MYFEWGQDWHEQTYCSSPVHVALNINLLSSLYPDNMDWIFYSIFVQEHPTSCTECSYADAPELKIWVLLAVDRVAVGLLKVGLQWHQARWNRILGITAVHQVKNHRCPCKGFAVQQSLGLVAAQSSGDLACWLVVFGSPVRSETICESSTSK